MIEEQAFVFQLLLMILYCNYVESVPDQYCLTPLNQSDCGTPPTPVFAYYKPESRCEIAMWRGCSTNNMFENEYHCSHHCIGKYPNYYDSGAYKGRLSSTINKLNINELEKLHNLLNEIKNGETGEDLNTSEEKLTNKLKTNFPKEPHVISDDKDDKNGDDNAVTQHQPAEDNEVTSSEIEYIYLTLWHPTKNPDTIEDFATLI